jgi:hypothetical protein
MTPKSIERATMQAAKECSTPHEIARREMSVLAALSLHRLSAVIGRLSNAEIKAAVESFEKLHPPTKPIDLSGLEPGHTEFIPLNQLVPGQTQISWDNVRQKMLALVEQFSRRRAELAHEKAQPAGTRHLLSAEEPMEGAITEDGTLAELTDNNHHAAALRALETIVEGMLAKVPPGQRPPCATRYKLELVRDLFGGDGVPLVPVTITAHDKRYLRMRNGTKVDAPPRLFSKLEDNPFRYLASQLCGKVTVEGKQGKEWIRVHGAEHPAWLKVTDDAPDFIEFLIAEVLEAAFKRFGLTYDPRQKLTNQQRLVARYALLEVKKDTTHPLHEIISGIGVVLGNHPRTHFDEKLKLKNGKVIVPPRYLNGLDRLNKIIPLIAKLSGKERIKPVIVKLQPGRIN